MVRSRRGTRKTRQRRIPWRARRRSWRTMARREDSGSFGDQVVRKHAGDLVQRRLANV